MSKIDRQEVDNALGQTAREIATRFDFKGTGASIEWKGEQAIEITASADDRATAVLDVFKDKLIKRNQSLKILDASEPRQSGQESKIGIALKEGISSEDAKKITKLIRDEGPKGVKAQIQGDELRVSSKKRDDLQAVQRAGEGAGLRLRGAVHQLPLIHAQEPAGVRTESAESAVAAMRAAARPRAVLRLGPQVAVDVQRDRRRGVTQRVLHGHHVAPVGDQARGVEVPQVVQGERVHAHLLSRLRHWLPALLRL